MLHEMVDAGPLAESAAATARSDVYAIGRGTAMEYKDRRAGQVIPGTKYQVDPKTLKRTGKRTFVNDPSLALNATRNPKVLKRTLDRNYASVGININLYNTETKDAWWNVDTENRLSNKLNKAIFNKLEKRINIYGVM